MDETVEVFSILGGIANIVMAGAAVLALTLWRKQIAGTSHHELAKQLSDSLRRTANARRECVAALRSLHSNDSEINSQLARALAPNSLRRGVTSLSDAVEKLESQEGQVAVLWGDVVLDLIEIIRRESKNLAVYIGLELTPNLKDTARGILVSSAPSGIAPSFTGSAYEKALKLYTQLALQWLGVHLGRAKARHIGDEELYLRRKQIDDEVAQLAAPEKSANAGELARKIAELGSPQELARRLGEELGGQDAAIRKPEP